MIILCPKNGFKNWSREAELWLNNEEMKKFFVLDKIKSAKTRNTIKTWRENGGIILTTYDKFLNIAQPMNNYVTNLQRAFVDPGPEILVMDEGHNVANRKSKIFLAISRVPTKKKIIVSGE